MDYTGCENILFQRNGNSKALTLYLILRDGYETYKKSLRTLQMPSYSCETSQYISFKKKPKFFRLFFPNSDLILRPNQLNFHATSHLTLRIPEYNFTGAAIFYQRKRRFSPKTPFLLNRIYCGHLIIKLPANC